MVVKTSVTHSHYTSSFNCAIPSRKSLPNRINPRQSGRVKVGLHNQDHQINAWYQHADMGGFTVQCCKVLNFNYDILLLQCSSARHMSAQLVLWVKLVLETADLPRAARATVVACETTTRQSKIP